jgi:HD-like signal output (HDOD) protein
MRPTTGTIQVPPQRPALSDGRRTELIERAIDQLPTLSVVATRLLQISSADRADMAEIVQMIESDPALSARLVGLCRRADKGLGDRITTARRAVLMLGFEAVRSAALSVSVYDVVRRNAGERTGGADHPSFDRDGFWRHSVCVACAAELIAQTHPRLRLPPQEAFLCGLLNSVGKMVLDHVLPRAFDNVVRQAMRRGVAVAPIERAILGVDHITAGRRIALHWCLPDSVVRAITDNDAPGGENIAQPAASALAPFTTSPAGATQQQNAIAGVVRAARALCRWFNLGWACEFDTPAHPGIAWREAGLLPPGPALITERLLDAIADRFKILGLPADTPARVALDAVEQAAGIIAESRTQVHEAASRADRIAASAEALAAVGVAMARGVDPRRAVLASARSLCGTPGVWLLARASDAHPWTLEDYSGGARLPLSSPMPAGTVTLLAAQSLKHPPSTLGAQIIGLTPWLGAFIRTDVSRLRATPLLWSRTGTDPCAVLLSDGDPGVAVPPSTLHAAYSLWRDALYLSLTTPSGSNSGQSNSGLASSAKSSRAETIRGEPSHSQPRQEESSNTEMGAGSAGVPMIVSLASAAHAAEEGEAALNRAAAQARSLVSQVQRASQRAPLAGDTPGDAAA